MENQFSRTELLIGKEAVSKLNHSKVAIFGIGGVGSYVCEGLARAGVQNFVLIDNDTISVSNINRQIHSTHATINQYKVDVMKDRILSINPNSQITTFTDFFMPNCKTKILDTSIDYIVDAVDTVTAKLEIIEQAKFLNIPVISCMGTGNKLDPTRLEISDISKTSVCPLAKVIRSELRKRGISKVKVLYSKEEPINPNYDNLKIDSENNKKPVPGSISFVPSVAGLIISSEVVKDLISLRHD